MNAETHTRAIALSILSFGTPAAFAALKTLASTLFKAGSAEPPAILR